MKRCPQCEFIYEDDQSLCDMDGVLLVMDARTFPNLQALATVPAKPQAKRVRAVPAFATIILSVVLGMVYYVSTQRHTDADSLIPPQPIAASLVNPVPAVKLVSEVTVPVEEPNPTATKAKPAAEIPSTVKKATTKIAVAAPAVPTRTAKPAPEPQKEESKVGSILKKTGRILKKPFKF